MIADHIFALEGRARFHISGADRVRYLNGQCTNDIKQASADRCVYALITDHKAHIAADMFVHVAGDALVVDVEPHLREAVLARLERYVIADDVIITDVTDAWRLYHVTGALRHGLAGCQANRLGEDGLDVWLPADSGLESTGDKDFETCRIAAGIPRHPNELNDTVFPADAGLEERAVSFTKGCYIGQEIVSRMRTTGKHPRVLLALRGEGLTVGMNLAATDKPENVIGSITSAADGAALGYVKQGELPADSVLLALGERHTLSAQVTLLHRVS